MSNVDTKVIVGWPDCTVSADGRIWRNGRPKAATLAKVGYLVVQRSVANKTQGKYLHRILLEAFVGPCPEGCEALHINGDRLDNSLANLRWGTRKENVADAIRHGTATIGAKNSQAKFNEAEILSIRRLRAQGVSAKEIAARFDVCRMTITNAVVGRTYQGTTK